MCTELPTTSSSKVTEAVAVAGTLVTPSTGDVPTTAGGVVSAGCWALKTASTQ
jgi:hypothetical protein